MGECEGKTGQKEINIRTEIPSFLHGEARRHVGTRAERRREGGKGKVWWGKEIEGRETIEGHSKDTKVPDNMRSWKSVKEKTVQLTRWQ